jgi:TolB protein
MPTTDRSALRALTLLALVLATGAAHAQLTVQITRGVTQPIPVAVVPFGGGGAVPLDVAQVIEADLARSGRFAALERSAMLQRPTSGAALDLSQWRLLKTDYVVIGRLAASGPGYDVEFELYNVVTGERLTGYRIPAGAGTLRLAAHRAADYIYEKILGVPGAFATRIAYVNVQGPPASRRWRLIVADADGENPQVVLESRDPVMSPAWSPDSARLAYVSFEGRSSAVYVQTLASGARERVSARAGINGAPAWSPDGRRLAITLSQRDGNVDIFVLELANGGLLRVTDDPAIDTEPCWAPDGRSLYFTSDRAGRPQIYNIALAAGERPRRITFEGAYNARARVSPDGKQLSVVTLDQGAYRIAVVDIASGRSRVLSGGHLDEGPAFAPNGQVVIYAARESGRGVLATVAVDGSVTSRISSADGDVREPAWSPRLVSP